MLENGTVSMLEQAGVGGRLHREGLVHSGTEIALGEKRQRFDFEGLVGKTVTVYGQTEVTKDLIEARLGSGAPLVWDVESVVIENEQGAKPVLHYVAGGVAHELRCDLYRGMRRFSWRQPKEPAGGYPQNV